MLQYVDAWIAAHGSRYSCSKPGTLAFGVQATAVIGSLHVRKSPRPLDRCVCQCILMHLTPKGPGEVTVVTVPRWRVLGHGKSDRDGVLPSKQHPSFCMQN